MSQSHIPPSDDDDVEIVASKSGPDITYERTNGKKVTLELDPLEWFILGLFTLAMTTILAVTGVV